MTKAEALLRRVTAAVHALPTDELSVQKLVKEVGYSRWQLQRTFLALTEISLSAHIRDVKLSRAAQQLIHENQGVLDIALAAGFGSQEAFTRAFKSKFALTPGEYRKRGVLDDISFHLFIPTNKHWSKAMNIKIETKPAMTLIGQQDFFNGHGMENANNFDVIPKLWRRFNAAMKTLSAEPEWTYGYVALSEQPNRGQLTYVAGFNKDDGPNDLPDAVSVSVPEQLYAIVPHHGLLKNIGETLDAFWAQWLPDSNYKMKGDINIEVYGSRFQADSVDSYFETWVPVEARE